MKNKIQIPEFIDGTNLSKKDKKTIYRSFVKLVLSGFEPRHFTTKLYDYLMNQQNFIAHYNKDGFWEARFQDLTGRLETIEQCTTIGGSIWRFSPEHCNNAADLNRAIAAFCYQILPALKTEVYGQMIALHEQEIKRIHKEIANETAK